MKKIRFIAALLCLLMINITPVFATEVTVPPKVIDEAELMTEAEEQKLSEKIDKIADAYQIDIIVVTKYDKNASTIQEEADLTFDNGGYGIGSSRAGILFLVSKNSREWAISTSGDAIGLFSDYDLNRLGSKTASNYFSSEDYYQGFDFYLSLLDKNLKRALNTDSSSGNSTVMTDGNDNNAQTTESASHDSKSSSGSKVLPALIIGLIITAISMSIMSSGMKTANMQSNANAYKQPDAASRIKRKDVFLTTNISKRVIPKDPPKNTASKTQTSVHRSSSGRTHGGSSGSF